MTVLGEFSLKIVPTETAQQQVIIFAQGEMLRQMPFIMLKLKYPVLRKLLLIMIV